MGPILSTAPPRRSGGISGGCERPVAGAEAEIAATGARRYGRSNDQSVSSRTRRFGCMRDGSVPKSLHGGFMTRCEVFHANG